MSANGFKIFPRRDGKNRSCHFTVKCGEAALITGFCLPAGASICINQVQKDHCNCEHFEKAHCEIGVRSGINDENCSGKVITPGCYVAVLCIPTNECDDGWDDDWGVYVKPCKALENIQTLAQVAALGA